MAERFQVYKCEMCGNIVEVLHGGKGSLECCGKEMILFAENTVDASKEKHVPVAEKTADGYVVKVGSVPHPMEEKHWIEWIQVSSGGRTCRVFLEPGMAPEAEICFKADGEVSVREYCNLHGLWKA